MSSATVVANLDRSRVGQDGEGVQGDRQPGPGLGICGRDEAIA